MFIYDEKLQLLLTFVSKFWLWECDTFTFMQLCSPEPLKSNIEL